MKRIKTLVSLSTELEELLSSRAGIDQGLQRKSKQLQELAAGVQALSDGYVNPQLCDWSALYKNASALPAYLLYYLPVNLVKIFPVMEELVNGGAFDPLERQKLSVLDIGCGPGTFLLGMLAYLSSRHTSESALQSITLTGIDRVPENIAAADGLIRQYGDLGSLPLAAAVQASFRRESVTSPAFLKDAGLFDMIIAGNVLAELPDDALGPCLTKTAEHLAPGGALIIIDPGTRRAARQLLEARDLLLKNKELKLYAPCLCAAACPLQDDDGQWCHEKLFWQPTEAVRLIDGVLGFTKEKGIKYSFLTFVKNDAHRLNPYADLDHDNIWRVSSYVIKNKGENRLWVCNGQERRLLRRLERNRSETNSDFDQAERGNLVVVDGAAQKASFYDIPRNGVFSILP